jgi:hypothetical protein
MTLQERLRMEMFTTSTQLVGTSEMRQRNMQQQGKHTDRAERNNMPHRAISLGTRSNKSTKCKVEKFKAARVDFTMNHPVFQHQDTIQTHLNWRMLQEAPGSLFPNTIKVYEVGDWYWQRRRTHGAYFRFIRHDTVGRYVPK